MITTVTLSPSIDKTVVLKKFDPDTLNRAESTRLDPGGKGVNVSLALSALGTASISVGLGFDGIDFILKTLERSGIKNEWVKCPGRIRINTKILDLSTEKTIELNEQNPVVSEKNFARLTDICRRIAKESDIVVLAGSIPPGLPQTAYLSLARVMKAVRRNIKIVIDAEGDALIHGLRATPELIKPNAEEFERTFGVKFGSDEEIIDFSRKVIDNYGVGMIIVSLGSEGVIAVTKGKSVKMPAFKVCAKSAQGAGDAMVAGICYAMQRGLPFEDTVRCGVCAAAGAVEREGTDFCTRERFEELLTKI